MSALRQNRQNEAHNNGNPADPEIKARNRASKTIQKYVILININKE